ncbi:MAG: CRISPR-associated endonuclease Cas2 [Bacteroidetes bacterium]|nr:CRISPR-associated endonuclease Cas2 [Bacteroidota bacterium]MBS1747701.1 CRISPR-associated endonuclease Cas2 [Bacteroidota bacterium]
MIIVAYDISNTKVRTKFSKFLAQYGVRVQFSVFEIENSKRVLDIVINKVETKFKKLFEAGDSIYMFVTDRESTISYGSASLLGKDLIII